MDAAPSTEPVRVVHLSTVHALRDPRIFYKEVGSLRATGYDVHLVAQHPRSGVVDGVPVVGLPPTRGRYRRLPLLHRAYRAARDLNAALYHIHDPELIPVARALQRTTGARVIYDMHEDYRGHGAVEGRLLRTLERWCFSWVDHVILAEDCYAPIVAGSGAASTAVLNYALMDPAPEPRCPAGRLEILYAGVQGRARGLDTLLDLAGYIVRERVPWRLTLAGVCYVERERRYAERRIRREGLAPALRLVGWDRYLPPAEMAAFFREAHVGLALLDPLPNYVETIPTKFYEYLHHGLPILCSDFPRWRAFVAEHGCGSVVDASDAGAVASVLRGWAADPDGMHRRSEAALRAAPRYHWSRMAERLLAVYERLLRP